jgi:hypothetical protein
MMAVLISSAFGATVFFLIVAVCVRGMKPVRLPSAQQDRPDCGAIPLIRSSRSLYYLLGNRRTFDRQPISGNIRVVIKSFGLVTTNVCSCVDISPRGIGLDCPELITLETVVQLTSDEDKASRFARIRYCELRGRMFRAGLEFIAKPED